MKKKYIFIYAIIALLFASCTNNNEPQELVVGQDTVTIIEGETASIPITSGNGGYQATSSNESVAIVTISSNRINITVIGHGTATIYITDSAGKWAAITVIGVSNAVNDAALRFEWDGTRVLLNEVNGWATINNFPSTGNIGIVHLEQRRVLRILGNNNYDMGARWGVHLHIIENGGEEQTIGLESFEIVENRDGFFTAVGNAGDRRLVIRYRVD